MSREFAEKVLNDIRLLSHEEFMMKYDPANKKGINSEEMKREHKRMQWQLRLIKRLPRKFYDQVVLHLMTNERFNRLEKNYGKR